MLYVTKFICHFYSTDDNVLRFYYILNESDRSMKISIRSFNLFRSKCVILLLLIYIIINLIFLSKMQA